MTTDYRRPGDAAGLAHNFRVFGTAECLQEPLYAALSRAIADDAGTIDLLMQAPYAQRRPVFLFAAVHDLLLAGHVHRLGDFYGTVASTRNLRTDVDDAAEAFLDFCTTHREALLAMFAVRSTQTNEIGRAAGLRLALALLPTDRPIALIDVGSSAGLNLLVDTFRFVYRTADGTTTVGPEHGVVVNSAIVDGWPDFAQPIATIAQRIGIDRAPLDVRDPHAARWLRACVWPSDSERHARLADAIACAQPHALDLRQGDANAAIVDVLRELGTNVRPVVFHSWVLSYLESQARRDFADRMRALVVERDGAWISAEGPDVVPGLAPPALPGDADAAMREATVWHLTCRERGVATSRAIARSQAHCRWIDWLG